MSNDDGSNVLPFKKPGEKKKTTTLKLDRSTIQSVILAISAIHRSTKILDECKTNIISNGIPCKTSGCACYIHMVSSMALEVIFDGPKSDEATKAIMFEYLHAEEASKNDHDEKS